MTKKYLWERGGFRVPAHVAGPIIEQLRQDHADEGLQADHLVEVARPKDHPLHPMFFYATDREMAHEHRLWIARRALHSLNVVVSETESVPVLLSVRHEDGGFRYWKPRAICSEEEKRRLFVHQSMLDILGHVKTLQFALGRDDLVDMVRELLLSEVPEAREEAVVGSVLPTKVPV